MTTIAYDRPVKDLIAGLDATEHVTHTQHRKTHVTLHHNGGRLSHEGVLSVWQTRPASAHFDIDAAGAAAQYVRVAEYAWATGSTDGNQRSISIEMCNETVGPDWRVSETTWRSAARLAGWLFARVIGVRPTRDNLVRHKYWSATSCAGPHIDAVYEQILAAAQGYYDMFISGHSEDDMSEVELSAVGLEEFWECPVEAPNPFYVQGAEAQDSRIKPKETLKAREWLSFAVFRSLEAYNQAKAANEKLAVVQADVAEIKRLLQER